MIYNPLKNSRSGFTLVELMVAMAIASFLLGAIYIVFGSVQKTSTSNEVTAKIMQALRTSIGFIESDIRMAGLDPSGNHIAGIVVATATELQFTSDRNMDGIIHANTIDDMLLSLQEQNFEQVTYFLDNTDLTNMKLRQCLSLGTAFACSTVVENVIGFGFEYFDATNPLVALAFPILNIASIRSIEVSIRVQQPAGIASPVSIPMTRRIYCRNLDM